MIPADDSKSLRADKAAPTKVLTCHVVSGTVMPPDAQSGEVKTVQREAPRIVVSSSALMLEDVDVIETAVSMTGATTML